MATFVKSFLTQRTLKDPLDSFQVDREIKELKNLLALLPLFSGTGEPEGEVLANIGAIYMRIDGGAGTTFYVKESGVSTKIGWVAK